VTSARAAAGTFRCFGGSGEAVRRAGVLLPLFSIRTARGWGLGEIPDIPAFARWASGAGMSVLQLLPVNEVSGGETSPYSAATAFALDPVYLALDEMEDFRAIGGRASLPVPDRAQLDLLAGQRVVDWPAVRALKTRALQRAFEHFRDTEWKSGSRRRQALERYQEEHRAWLPDYSLWRVVHDREQKAWWHWPAPLATRQGPALERVQAEMGEVILRCCWLQWQLDDQWQRAREQARQLGVALKGDLPFMVSADSADVWARAAEFRLDRSVGTPPDAFSPVGQDWGLPAYDWNHMLAGGLSWLRSRAARAGALYDLFRVDHVIGFYRTWSRPRPTSTAAGGTAAPGSFSPLEEADQVALGERVLTIFKGCGEVIAEDLGMVPEFLPPSLERLCVPGYRVLRWETRKDGSYRDPSGWPELSVATNGTHDVEPNAAWYETLRLRDRRHLLELPELRHLDPRAPFGDDVRDALLRVVYGAASRLVINPLQDLLGLADRINVPGTVSASNWSYRMPMDLAALEGDGAVRERLVALAAWSRRLLQAAPGPSAVSGPSSAPSSVG
jgi:4-alpha-glucanotransferase